jgi:AraC family carnitine catabolism transcriptional activator
MVGNSDNSITPIQVPPRLRIGMLLLPDFNSMAAQAFIDPFRAANYIHGDVLFLWDFLSLDSKLVQASNGLIIGQTQPFYEIENKFDMVVVNASWAPERFKNKKLQAWLRRMDKQGTALVALDTGAFVFAFAGLLNGYRAVVHYEHMESFRELFPGICLEQQLFVIDRNRLTCCGGLASADLAMEILRSLHGIDLANTAAHYISLERLRAGQEGQRPKTHEPIGYTVPEGLRKAMLLMERNLEEPLRVTEIAQHMESSQRQLERLFRQYTGLTPIRYYLNIRLDRARGFITQTELSNAEVANACGFGSAEQLARAYKIRFGATPTTDKMAGRIPFQYRSFPQYLGV